MDDLKYWLAFSKVEFAGSKFIERLWNHFDSMKEAWFASSYDLLEIESLKLEKVNKFIEARKNVNPDQILEEIKEKDINVLTLEDNNYPALLKQIYDPPAVLFIKGDIESCNLDKTLAIVGSRKASHYITEILGKIINEMKGSDTTIVSGMALGVDTCAHNAAIKNNLKTIAVLGAGFEWIYPKENKKLFAQIADGNGALISEYYPAEPPEIWKFPKRNRIISGLSQGTLIAEAGLKSGALITARLCLEHNRELMCIPGLVTNPNTEGTHKLLQDGAGLVTNIKDIFDALNWSIESNTSKNENNFQIELLDNEKKIYEILSLEPVQFDEILNQSKLNAQELMVALTSLELNSIVKQMPGQKYIRNLSN